MKATDEFWGLVGGALWTLAIFAGLALVVWAHG